MSEAIIDVLFAIPIFLWGIECRYVLFCKGDVSWNLIGTQSCFTLEC